MRKGLIAAVSLFLLATGAFAGERTTVHPADKGQALVNPQMGWKLNSYSNILTNYGSKLAPSDTLDDFPGLSTIYLRLPWAYSGCGVVSRPRHNRGALPLPDGNDHRRYRPGKMEILPAP